MPHLNLPTAPITALTASALSVLYIRLAFCPEVVERFRSEAKLVGLAEDFDGRPLLRAGLLLRS